MLHPGIGNRNQFVAVLVKRILPEPVLECLQHAWDFFKLLDGSVLLMGQHPVVYVQHATQSAILLREVLIVADIDVDSVVINRIDDLPVKSSCLASNVVIDFS